MSPKQRAAVAVTLFTIAGAAGVLFSHRQLPGALPMILLYVLLVWNDYCSIAYFSTIIAPQKRSQILLDLILGALNIALALCFSNPAFFNAVATVFFALATLKYAGELAAVENPALLYRKIVVDIMGTIVAATASLAILFGQGHFAVPLEAAFFLIASIYLILINPLYQPPKSPR